MALPGVAPGFAGAKDEMVSGLRPAVFLDRDGVLTVPEFRDGRSYAPRQLQDFKIYDSAASCLAQLKKAGFLLITVTNQPDVGNGLVEQGTVEEMHRRLTEALPIDGIEVCYHSQKNECSCRKPKPGMLINAGQRLGVDWRRSFMVGDRGSDVLAGKAAGCRTIFIDLSYRDEDPNSADYTVHSLAEATDIILRECSLTGSSDSDAWPSR